MNNDKKNDTGVKKKIFYKLGAPIFKEDKERFESAIWKREDTPKDAFEYVDKVIDRQINKAVGLLTANAVLFTCFTLNSGDRLTKPASILTLISSLLLLYLLYVVWSESDSYENYEADFKRACQILYKRSYVLSFSIMTSIFSLLLALIQNII